MKDSPMDAADELHVPTAAEDETRVPPVVARVADAIGALAAAEGLVSPRRLETALSVANETAKVFDEPSLMRVLTFRALSSPLQPRTALAALKPAAAYLSAPERATLMRELTPMVSGDAKPTIAALAPELAVALGVPLPDNLRHDGGGMFNAIGLFAGDAIRKFRSEAPVLVAARQFAVEFGEGELLAVVDKAHRAGDESTLISALQQALAAVRERVIAVARAAEAEADARSIAEELDKAADRIEHDARQRDAAIVRRATMLKRQVREDLNALVEDAAEEFEVDFRC